MSQNKSILQHLRQGYSQRTTAKLLGVSRNTVAKISRSAALHPISDETLAELNETELDHILFPELEQIPILVMPDFEYIHKELLKSGVTLKLLWQEYVDDCRNSKRPPYMYSQFCKLYQDYVDKHNLTMHIRHKPGDKLMVDWAGSTIPLFDKATGSSSKVYLFVAVLPFSMYCYTQACRSMKEEDWIDAHVQMYEYFKGSTRLLIPDNLKAGIVSNKKYEDPVLNQTYRELAEHYQTTILPARILSPKDKAAVESSVGSITSHIIAKLRGYHFFSLAEINQAVRKDLDNFNRAPFQKKDGSRYSVFSNEEQPFLQPLPVYPYELAQWKSATVKSNYHITLDYQNYSVPYEYVKKRVEVRSTKNLVEVFYKGSRICSHKRLTGRRGQYSTLVDHMPANHQLYSQWNRERFTVWAADIGESTNLVIQKIFDSYRVEEQAYKSCLPFLKLADKYTPQRLEKACELALTKITNPRYKNIRLILSAEQDKQSFEKTAIPDDEQFAIVRGASYYGGNHHEG